MKYVLEITFTDGSKEKETWTTEKIRRAFNFGEGTIKDFHSFISENKNTVKLIETM